MQAVLARRRLLWQLTWPTGPISLPTRMDENGASSTYFTLIDQPNGQLQRSRSAPGRIRPNRSGGTAIASDSPLKARIEAIYLSVAAGRRTFHDGLGGSVRPPTPPRPLKHDNTTIKHCWRAIVASGGRTGIINLAHKPQFTCFLDE